MFDWLRKNPRTPGTAPHGAAFQRAETVLFTVEGDRAVLLDPVRGKYFGLDEVGVRIWELLPTHPTAVALAERLVEEYDAPRERLEKDTAALLEQLAIAQLVVPR